MKHISHNLKTGGVLCVPAGPDGSGFSLSAQTQPCCEGHVQSPRDGQQTTYPCNTYSYSDSAMQAERLRYPCNSYSDSAMQAERPRYPCNSYSDSAMQVALDMVCQGHSIRHSARCAGVPWTTVRDRWTKYKLHAFH
ncbi:hypothetical protein ACOMHN_005498 [Nucella lapillus]